MKKPTNSPFNKLFKRGMFHIDDETLIAFLKDVLPDHEKENTKMHLRECSDCFMHMSVFEKSLQEKEELELVSTPEFLVEKAKALKPKQSILNQIKKIYKNYLQISFIRIPAWGYGISSAVVVSILILIMFYPTAPIKNYPMGNKLSISKTPQLRAQDEEAEIVKYKGMSVELSEDGKFIIFQWQEVSGAEYYDIYLYKNKLPEPFAHIEKIGETKFQVSLEKLQLKRKVNYFWEITGRLKDGGSFYAKRGFMWRK